MAQAIRYEHVLRALGILLAAVRAMVPTLREVLADIWRTEEIPVAERRRLAHAAVARAQAGPGFVGDAVHGARDDAVSLEEALLTVAKCIGVDKVNITAA